MFDDGADTPAPSKTAVEVMLQTEPGGYNSGRAYRVRMATARDAELLVKDVGQLATAAREKLQNKPWLRSLQVGLPAYPHARQTL